MKKKKRPNACATGTVPIPKRIAWFSCRNLLVSPDRYQAKTMSTYNHTYYLCGLWNTKHFDLKLTGLVGIQDVSVAPGEC